MAKWIASVLALAVLGCGDGVVGDGYRGVPQYTFSGQVDTTQPGARLDPDIEVAVFWSFDGSLAIDTDNLIQHDALSADVRFPGIFEINVFGPPPEYQLLGGPHPDLRVGLILAHVDNPGSEFVPGDVRGGAPNQVLFYADAPIPAEESPTRHAIAPGYSVARLPLPCRGEVLDAPDHCGLRLGEGCTSGSCAPGVSCFQGTPELPFPGGMCVKTVEEWDCQPENAVVFAYEPDLPENRFWMPRCASSADCRANEGYECRQWEHTEEPHTVCVPGAPLTLFIGPGFRVEDLCATDG